MVFSQVIIYVIIAFFSCVTFSQSYMLNAYGWHEQLGITDQQASTFSQTNPNDPQITNWKNAMQHEIEQLKGACFEPFIVGGSEIPLGVDLQGACKSIAQLVYDNCLSHPGALLACLDKRIAQWSSLDIDSTIQLTNKTVNDNGDDSKDLEGIKYCSDFAEKNFKVQPGDPYDLDRDGDGIACEE